MKRYGTHSSHPLIALPLQYKIDEKYYKLYLMAGFLSFCMHACNKVVPLSFVLALV